MPTDHDHSGLAELLGTVGRAMTTPVLVLDADTPADVAARQLRQQRVWGAPVLHRGRVVGVVTLEEILARPLPGRPVAQLSGPFLRDERLLASLRVWQLMHAGPIVVAADQPLVEAARLLEDQHLEVLAVVDGHGRPVGVITAADLIRALAGHARPADAGADRGQDQAEAVRRR
jgi:CBS domain-containing protein